MFTNGQTYVCLYEPGVKKTVHWVKTHRLSGKENVPVRAFNDLIRFDYALWYIKPFGLFNAKSYIYIYIYDFLLYSGDEWMKDYYTCIPPGGAFPSSAYSPAALRTWPTWLLFWLTTEPSACGYLCIYYFITPMHSFRFFFRMSTQESCFRCSLVYTPETSCLKKTCRTALSKFNIQHCKWIVCMWYYF